MTSVIESESESDAEEDEESGEEEGYFWLDCQLALEEKGKHFLKIVPNIFDNT
jgi:hypothetical protein